MTKLDFLEVLYDQYMDDLHDASADWRFEIPKRGYEEQHPKLKEQISLIEEMMDDYKEKE